MIWRNPEAFFLLIPLLLAAAFTYLKGPGRRASLQLSSQILFGQIPKTWRVRFSWFPDAFKFLAMLLIVIALARPQATNTQVKRNVEGIDIMVVLDVSDSMMIEDMLPNRIEASKKVIKEFIQRRVSDRIGLMIFSGDAFTRVPPTLDYKILLANLEQVTTTRSLKMGTAIGVGLGNAVARLKDSTAKSRVIIFMTDGESNTGTIAPETAIDIAKGYGIRVYSIGMGLDGESQLPIYTTDAFGNTVKHYQPIHSSVNDDLLSRMAAETGGKYYRAAKTPALEKVFREIDHLERTKIQVNQFTRYTELFPPYVSWAVLLYVLAVFGEKFVLRRVP